MDKFNGNTHVGYFTEKGTFCLDHLTHEHYGHTDEEVERMQANDEIEEINNFDYNHAETCKVCGRNLIDKELHLEEAV